MVFAFFAVCAVLALLVFATTLPLPPSEQRVFGACLGTQVPHSGCMPVCFDVYMPEGSWAVTVNRTTVSGIGAPQLRLKENANQSQADFCPSTGPVLFHETNTSGTVRNFPWGAPYSPDYPTLDVEAQGPQNLSVFVKIVVDSTAYTSFDSAPR